MLVRELISKVRDKLQDTDSVYWSDSEFIDLYNECKRFMSAERMEQPTYVSLDLFDNTYAYTIDGVLRFLSAKDSNGKERTLTSDDSDTTSTSIIINSYNSIYVNNPETGVTVTFKVISYPEEDNLNDTIRMGDEESFTYFILSKAYEKDTDMEQFQKAGYFWNMFIGALRYAKRNSSLNYIEEIKTTKSYFF